eukprot:gene11335-biopygen7841
MTPWWWQNQPSARTAEGLWEKRLRIRPGRVRFFKFYRVGRVRGCFFLTNSRRSRPAPQRGNHPVDRVIGEPAPSRASVLPGCGG